IGPMGLGGDTTVLGVNIEYAHRHPGSLPVAIAFQCWAARKASARVSSDGRVEYLTHKIKGD
ncbi:fumarate hydratase, partial [Candidatus Bathyarchaeota archaeon]|nr:fumarate hydratase [Candidatus Bathyarchaeota archaeon]